MNHKTVLSFKKLKAVFLFSIHILPSKKQIVDIYKSQEQPFVLVFSAL